MNKIIIALIGLALIATPALAATVTPTPVSDVRTSLYTAGETNVKTVTWVLGTDTWMPVDGLTGVQPTAWITNNIKNNDGSIFLGSQVTDYGKWGLQEDSQLTAYSGYTDAKKEVDWLTIDTDTNTNGELKYPTVTNIYTDFASPGQTETITSVHNVANLPGSSGTIYYLTQQYKTDAPMYLGEDVGINQPTRCAPLPPKSPVMPTCPTGICHT